MSIFKIVDLQFNESFLFLFCSSITKSSVSIDQMNTMNERLLQFIWQHLYFNQEQLVATNGQDIQILSQGLLNRNQGPDFLHAKILLNQITWVGNIELHIKTSDWEKHGHSHDEHYNNIILHVVWEQDVKDEKSVPVLELKNRISNSLLNRYNELMQQNQFIPCENQIAGISNLVWMSWKERMVAERLFEKNEKINQLLQQTNFHWEEVFWQLLARNFGIPINTDAFEAVAKSLPITILAKHKNQIHQLEAMLLGQAGLLNQEFREDYPVLLHKEYQFLKKKHQLQPISMLMNFLRMRPSNFPTIRFAQLAMLIHESSHLFSKILEAKDLETIKKLLSVTANDYWHYHYTFNEPSAYKIKKLGSMMVESILINTIIPVLFSYAMHHNKQNLKQKAIQWLQQLPKENNSVTKKWEACSVTHDNAFDSQALLYLKKNYCAAKLCLNCAIGNSIFKKQVTS